MKKLFFPVIAALLLGLTVSSCTKDEPVEIIEFESMNTVWYEFTIHSDDWKIDPASQDLVCSYEWPSIDETVLACGNVMVYYYEDGGRQVPLPYVRRWEYLNPSTCLVDQVPVNIRFDIEPGQPGKGGIINFVISDLSSYRMDPADLGRILGPMDFRAVCTYPVIYRG